MTTVTVSPKFQVVIPSILRKRFDIDPGEKMQIIAYENRIELIPVRKMKTMRGFLNGISTAFEREKDRA